MTFPRYERLLHTNARHQSPPISVVKSAIDFEGVKKTREIWNGSRSLPDRTQTSVVYALPLLSRR